MSETIEAFVGRLQSDGVKAGREAADKIRAEAEEQARQIVQSAETKARKLMADAQAESEKTRARVETELKLATRDAMLRLQEALNRSLRAVIESGARHQFGDGEFLKSLLREVIRQYVEADIEGGISITCNLTVEMQKQLAEWAIHELHQLIAAKNGSIDLHGTLRQAGFELKMDDSTLEITAASVVDVLSQMVGPQLRKLLASASAEGHG